MKKTTLCKRGFALFLASLMALTLAACRDPKGGSGLSAKDAQECVQVELDTTYKGQFTGFVKFYNNVTTSDAKEQYNDKIEGEAYLFLYYFGPDSLTDESSAADPSDMQIHRAKELYKKIYTKSDYSIVSSSKQDDGTFAVKVTVRPINLMSALYDSYEEYFNPFWEKFNSEQLISYLNTLTEEELADWYTSVYVPEYYDTLLDLMESTISDLGYKDEKSIVIQVQQSEDGSLYISTEDWTNLDNLIIDYSGE